MTAQLIVWTLAWDTREGTDCKVFASESGLVGHLGQIVRNDISALTGEEAARVRVLLESGDLWAAWEFWCESCKDALDTYKWDQQPLEVKTD